MYQKFKGKVQQAKKKRVAKVVELGNLKGAKMPKLKTKRSYRRWTLEETNIVKEAVKVAKRGSKGINVTILLLRLLGRSKSAIRNKVKEQALIVQYFDYYTYTNPNKIRIRKNLRNRSKVKRLFIRLRNRFN